MEKPQILYRGLHVNHDVFEKMDFHKDLVLDDINFFVDKNGVKRVSDDNEYGIYLTDVKSVASDVYGNVHSYGKKLCNLLIGGRPISMPQVGVVLEIDPNQTENLHKPNLNPVYTNNLNRGGNEWIADFIPASGYKVSEITIGNDILHDEMYFKIEPTDNIDDIQEIMKQILNERELHLKTLENCVQKVSQTRLSGFTITDISFLKKLCGENGIAYKKLEQIDLSTKDGQAEYVLLSALKRGEDYNNLKTLDDICENFKKSENENISQTFSEQIDKEKVFIEKRTSQNLSIDRNQAKISLYRRGIDDIKKRTQSISH